MWSNRIRLCCASAWTLCLFLNCYLTATTAESETKESVSSSYGTCGKNEWPTYGHDAQRTSASDGCVSGPLTIEWTYIPSGAKQKGNVTMVESVISSTDMLFVRYASTYGPQLEGLSKAGSWKWTWAAPGGRDRLTHHWATAAFGVVMVGDDGLFLVDASNGVNKVSIGKYDEWGQTAASGNRFYMNSDLNAPDGPGLYIGSYDSSGKTVWRNDVYSNCDGLSETFGSLAMDGGMVFRSGVYSADETQNSASVGTRFVRLFSSLFSGSVPESGLRSYDAAKGTPRWKQKTLPQSALSVGRRKLYLIENSKVVARAQKNGVPVWSRTLAGRISRQAPVVALDLVIVATDRGVQAFHANNGKPAWSANNLDAAEPEYSGSGPFFECPGSNVAWATMPFTSLAAALGSQSLIVTAKDGIHILALSDGQDLWHGSPFGVVGPLRNPIIVDHTVYAIDRGASKAGRLVALISH